MVTTLHLRDVGPVAALSRLRSAPAGPGLRYSEALTCAPLSRGLVPRPRLGHVGLLCVWDDDAAVDAHLAADPDLGGFRGGYSVRMRPTRVVGAWPPIGPIVPEPDGGAPYAVLTLGRLRPARTLAFLRASARAEGEALDDPALVLSTALARPPYVVATFSIWSDVERMREYVTREGGGHRAATETQARKPFHSASAFIRFHPYDQEGEWPPGRS